MSATAPARVGRGRPRSLATVIGLVIVAIALPVGLLAGWTNATVYDSARFSQRSVDILQSPTVQRELATKLTEQLALGGNRQAVDFRPAFELAVEAAIDTDTFQSVFRTAVRRVHEALLAGQSAGAGLDLSDSVAIIASTLSLPSTAAPGQQEERALGSSLTDITDRLARLRVWQLDGITAAARWIGLGAALAAGVAAIAAARDRRRAVRALGLVIVADGLLVAAVVPVVSWLVGQRIDDAALAGAVRAAIGRAMGDLTSIGLWTAGYGIVIAAAAAAMAADARRLTPAHAVRVTAGWMARARASTGGTIALGAAGLVAGVLLIRDPQTWALVAVLGAGLWLAYFGLTEILGLVRTTAGARGSGAARGVRRRNLVLVSVGAAVLAAVVSVGLVTSTRGAAQEAEAAGEIACNGETDRCDRPLNLALFAGSHNSMSSALYPGWLFAEQVRTIASQLDGGVRALLFDTHYGVESVARLPGSGTPLILTDRAAELEAPTGEQIDPAIAARAEQLAARAPPSANSARSIYLCHNYCELGAVRFDDVLADIKQFMDTHPDDVVIIIIQDATTPVDTAAAIEASGLAERAYTLDRDRPLPTLGEMIESGRTLLVFAEGGGAGAPAWYQPAYEHWFQETVYTFPSIEAMTCESNRGPSDAPLFLVNHWVGASPPDPALAARANSPEVLGQRLRDCLVQRGRVPNVVALDFALRGGAVETAASFDDELVELYLDVRNAGRSASGPGAPASTTTLADPADPADPASPTTSVTGAPAFPPINAATPIATLTGGDPQPFCAAVDPMLRALSAWGITLLASTPSIAGQPDFAFAPVAAQTIDAALAAAPTEIAVQLAPSAQRAAAAVEALRAAGLDDAAISALADLAAGALADPDNPDPLVVEDLLLDDLRTRIGADALAAAAGAFAQANPQPPGLFDLGDVSDEVARAAGYDCLAG